MKLSLRSPFGVKAAPLNSGGHMTHPGSSGGGGLLGMVGSLFSSTTLLMNSTNYNWEKEVADVYKASVLMAPVNWLMRTFPEAPLVYETFQADKKRWEPAEDPAILDLLANPNPFYNGETLLMCLALDLAFGNAFILKLRNENRKVVQLWWIPRQFMRARYRPDGSTYIDYWEYSPNGTPTDPIKPEDVIHIKFGLDPRDIRMGLSPLGSLVRETAIDEQASNFTATILKNLGIIGIVLSPKVQAQGAKAKTANVESVQAVKEYLMRQFTGDKRAEPLALGAPTDAQLLQYNMQGFDVGPIRDVSEERVCAAIGIPAAVVGFGTGLQQTKVGATMKEMRQLAWIGCVIPNQRIVANELTRSLLPEFVPNAKRSTHRLKFDSAAVPLLWETPSEKHDRIRKDWDSGLIKLGEARLETGRPAADEKDDGYKKITKNSNADTGDQQPKPDAAPADPGQGD